MTELRARRLASLGDIAPETWDACAYPDRGKRRQDAVTTADSSPEDDHLNPFISHDFLSALEESGCVGGRTGWTPSHVVIETAEGEVLATAPAYLKAHSQGEYVFDHGWADAMHRAGGRYYPKLQVTVPFTPATGSRLLVRHDTAFAPETLRAALIDALRQIAAADRASSVHVTFTTQADQASLVTSGLLPRFEVQYHWQNEGFATYDDFLATLASRKRKALKRERRDALAPGLTVHHLTGDDLTAAVWDTFFAFYMDTGSRKYGRPYLNRAFYSLIGERLADRIVLVMVARDGNYIAGAINFLGGSRLYGRHWGCIEEHPFLHFEVCYHQAIEIAIARGLNVVEAGAQGEHKLARGYRPVITTSAHHLFNPSLSDAVARYLERERPAVIRLRDEMALDLPFRQAGDCD
jgi:predicted N-acyltransferase